MTSLKNRNMIKLNEFFRLKVTEFINRLDQAKQVIPNHNLSVGMIGEEILRVFLREMLPKRYSVTQGFVEYDGDLSRQCDIIIYDSHNYAPLVIWGNLEIIPSIAVVAIIEVEIIDTYAINNRADSWLILFRPK